MKRLLANRVVRFVAPAVIALSAASAALAYWTGTGGGSAVATGASSVAVVLTPGAPSQQLHPGATASVATTISNSNPVALQIDALALDTAQGTNGFGVDAGHAGCALAALAFTAQTNGGGGWIVPAKVNGTDGTLALDLVGAISMSNDAADACQGANFTVYLTVNP